MARILGRLEPSGVARLAAFVGLAAFLVFCATRHEPWRDEYQTFLVATRTENWAEFWIATRYERTPPLHFLIQRALWPIAEGWISPRAFIRAVTIPFSLATFWLLLFRFRFPAALAILLAANVYFFREWGVLSRS